MDKTFYQDVKLNQDIVCDKVLGGPRMGQGTTLDCNGHSITGFIAPGGGEFTYSNGVTLIGDGVTIKNCIISNFDTGIKHDYIYNDNVVHNVIVKNNDFYGIAAWGNRLTLKKVIATKNGYGIDLNNIGHVLDDVVACDNTYEDIYSPTFKLDVGDSTVSEFKNEIIWESGPTIDYNEYSTCTLQCLA